METIKRVVVLLTLGFLTTGQVQSTEEPVKRISNTSTASCLVKITCDPAIMPLNLETIDYLLRSSGVGGKAASEVLDLSINQAEEFFSVENVQSSAVNRSAVRFRSPGRLPSPSESVDEMSEYDMMETRPTRTYTGRSGRSSSVSGRRSLAPGANSPLGAELGRRTELVPSSNITGSSADKKFYLFSLSVQLPDEIKPAAREFMNALVNNLRQSLMEAYSTYDNDFQMQLQFAEDQRERARSELEKVMEQAATMASAPVFTQNPADAAVNERLETLVDLSDLNTAMAFADVITKLKEAVDPPLQIQPNWKDLLENADVEPTTPAGMDPLTGIKLRKALEILLTGVSSDSVELGYVVDDGVVLIATEESLPKRMVSVVYDIPISVQSAGSGRELAKAIQESIEPDSWFDVSDMGEGTISIYMGRKLVINQSPEIHRKIAEFLQSMTRDIPASAPVDIPAEILISDKQELLRKKLSSEMDVARLRASQSAIEEQIAAVKNQIEIAVKNDSIASELQQLVEMHAAQLSQAEKQHQEAAIAEMKENLARARIELARHREQLSKSAGGDQLVKLNNLLADITIEFAQKTAELQVLNDQLDQTQQQLAAATVLDPQVSRLRWATRAFEIADQRVMELNKHSINLQPPVVSVIGVE